MKGFFILALAVACSALPAEVRRDNIDERGDKFEGDMILPPGMNKAGIIGSQYRWPNKELVYEIGSGFTQEELSIINAAFNEISSKTCIRFRARTTEAAYVYIQRGGAGSGCWSYVGRLGYRQELNLQAPGCVYTGIVAHELIHAIGFFHEQSRTDRDDYVTINWSNIQQGTESNFDKYTAAQVSPFNVPYDYGSVMHYSAYSFAVNPNIPTIIPKDPNAVIGQRDGLSSSDAQKINNMYGC